MPRHVGGRREQMQITYGLVGSNTSLIADIEMFSTTSQLFEVFKKNVCKFNLWNKAK